MMSPVPLGGSKTGKNPTDRAELGSKVYLLVDERGAPLAILITGANEHDKWSADDLTVHIVATRPNSEQHFCADKGYDYEDIQGFVGLKNYIAHIKHRFRKNEPKYPCPIQGKRVFLPDVGSWKEHLTGCQNAVVFPLVGAKSLKTGWLLSTWPALKSCSI